MGRLVEAIQRFVGQATEELVERIAGALEAGTTWDAISRMPHIATPVMAGLWTEIMHAGRNTGRSPAEIALAVRAACAVEARHREAPRLEMVLSGPTFPPYEMRRTDEAVLEVIQHSHSRLTLISFALYRIERLTRALDEARQRGVVIRMFVEAETLHQTITRLYGEVLAQQMRVYTWDNARRPHSSQGKPGMLHAKAITADAQTLFISSANLTEHAMSLNIELGMLVQGGDYPAKVENVFDTYLARGIFKPLSEPL